MASAASLSILELETMIPPKADTGSDANAVFQASNTELLDAIPQALLCFNIATVVSSNSLISDTAASISKRLLYDISRPCNCSNKFSKSP